MARILMPFALQFPQKMSNSIKKMHYILCHNDTTKYNDLVWYVHLGKYLMTKLGNLFQFTKILFNNHFIMTSFELASNKLRSKTKNFVNHIYKLEDSNKMK